MSKFLNIVRKQNYLNFGELVHTIVGANAVGLLIGVLIVALSAVSANIAAIVPNPYVGFIVAQVIAQAVIALKKLSVGEPAPASA